jgi:hypothetical protein
VLDVLFGCKPADVEPDLVCTPIPAFYAALVDAAEEAVEHRGWWRLATVAASGRRYCVVQHFEGSRVVDVLHALAGPASRVAFLGLAGSLHPAVRIGDLVRIGAAVRAGLPDEKPADPGAAGTAPGLTAVTVDGLLEKPTGEGRAQLVDLETHFFFRAARAAGVAAATGWVLVTDEPGTRPFWQVPLGDPDLRRAAAALRASLHDWLDAPAGRVGRE